MSALATAANEASFRVVVGDTDCDPLELRVIGELDVASASELRGALADVIAARPGRVVVVDCAEVRFIDSTGLGVLVGGLKRARDAGGDLRLRSLRRGPLKAMEITGLTEVFTID